jgi:putative lipoic acid-binding regulatory protein
MRQKDAPEAFPLESDLCKAALEYFRAQPDIDQKSSAVELQKTRVSAAAARQDRPSCRHLVPPALNESGSFPRRRSLLQILPGAADTYHSERAASIRTWDENVDNLPSAELLESTHEFPGPYMFKVIGRSGDGFVALVVAAVREELEGEIDPPYRVRETSTGRHIAVTVEPQVQNAWEVLAVYQRLGQIPGLEYVF